MGESLVSLTNNAWLIKVISTYSCCNKFFPLKCPVILYIYSLLPPSSSGGVGRTGTFIALDILLQHIKDHNWVDVFGLACEMRRSRDHMVETEVQWIVLMKCIHMAYITLGSIYLHP